MSQTLMSDATAFVLDEGKSPHMTVYMARFPRDAIPAVVKAVERVVRLIQPFRCEHVGYLLTEGRYLEASFRRTTELVALHELLIRNLALLRFHPHQPVEESFFAPYTTAQRRNAEATGYDLAHGLFRPHVTLARYKTGRVPSRFPVLPEAPLSFDLTRIGLYKADENGAATELLKAFQVSSPAEEHARIFC